MPAHTLLHAFMLITLALNSGQQTTSSTKVATNPPRPNPNAAGIYHTGDGVTAPKLLSSVEPEFAEKAGKRKIVGVIKLHLIVETDGHVRDVTVTQSASEGYKKKKDREAAQQLDQQAIKAASQYRFEPAQFQGKPVPAETTVEIDLDRF